MPEFASTMSGDGSCDLPVSLLGHCLPLVSLHCYDCDGWQQKINAALDPNNASGASFYTDSEFKKNPPTRHREQVE